MQEPSVEAKISACDTGPGVGAFALLLITLWALNLADIFQTLYLKESGLLAQEANFFIDFFLKEGRLPFIGAKILALILITLILVRGWNSKDGIKMRGANYDMIQVRRAIYFLLSAGVFYYTVIVVFPFVAMLLAGAFTEG